MTPAEPHRDQGGAVYRVAKSDVDALIADVKSECDQMHTSGNIGIHSCMKWILAPDAKTCWTQLEQILVVVGRLSGGKLLSFRVELFWTVVKTVCVVQFAGFTLIDGTRGRGGGQSSGTAGVMYGGLVVGGWSGVIGSATLEAHNTTCAIRPWAKTNSVTNWTTIRYKSLLHCAAMWTKELSKEKTLLSKKLRYAHRPPGVRSTHF